jgi:3-oxoacyl-[acyl-carrier-protein] synthase II
VLEAAEHAAGRSAKPLARLSAVLSNRGGSQDATAASLSGMWQAVAPRLTPGRVAVISGATGAEPVTSRERAWLETLTDIPVRASGTYIGHAFEPQFAMNIALATLALERQKLFPPADSSGVERAMQEPPDQIVVTGVGHWRGEGMALVEAVR